MFLLDKEYRGWPFGRIMRHVLYWSFWLTFYCIVNGSHYGHQYIEWFMFELWAMTVKLPYTYLVAYYLFPKYLPPGRHLILGVGILLFAFLGMLLLTLLSEMFPFEMIGKPTGFWSAKTFYRFVDLIYVASPVVVIKMMQQYLRQKDMYALLREEKTGAELQMLKNQLQPHFLFNTINNIYGMVLSEDPKAADAILKLSDIMSYMLYECNADHVRLDKEIAILENYIQLEKIRYGERLDLAFQIEGDITGKIIPPLLLIPFVENAFKHGVSQDEKHSWVRVWINMNENKFEALIENSIPQDISCSFVNIKSGIGLENVKRRLELLYADNHKLRIIKTDSFLVNISISL